jgi:hypothetical protein
VSTPAEWNLLKRQFDAQEDGEMNQRDQKLLDKQLWGVSSRSPQNGIIILMMIAVFLVGVGMGDVVSKAKQANTHYAALISYPNGQE